MQASSSSVESIPLTLNTDDSALHHKAAYTARRMLPRVRPRRAHVTLRGAALAAGCMCMNVDVHMHMHVMDPASPLAMKAMLPEVLHLSLPRSLPGNGPGGP